MKTRKKLLLLFLFVGLVLCLTSTLIDVHADDTYNFYFQKAPGPTVVNQGVAGPTNPKDVMVAPVVNQSAAAPAAAPAPVQSSVAEVKPAEESYSGQRTWEFSLGYAGSRYGGKSNDDYRYAYSPQESSAMINGAQYAAGLQFNFSENFALMGEAFRLTKLDSTVNGKTVQAHGSPWDFGGGLVVTPIHLRAGPNMRLNMAGLIGGMSVPFHQGGYTPTGASDGSVPLLGHAGTLYYGARLGLEISNRIGLTATVRRLDRFSSTHGTASVALLF